MGLVAFLLNLGYAFIHCEDGTAFRTFNLCILRNPCAPKRKNCQNRQCQKDAHPFPHYPSPPFITFREIARQNILQTKRITKIRFHVKKKIKISFLPGFPSPYFFFLGLAFFVAFFALGCFIPHDIFMSPPMPFYHTDLFISFKLVFVKSFLMDANH